MRFKKIYIEIGNVCNFNCSFCPPSIRQPKFMTVEEFDSICQQVKVYTNYIYLHVLGEPLIHPNFDKILQKAQEHELFVNISTNGSHILKQKEMLQKYNIRQINISLHDAEENIQKNAWKDYISNIIDLAQTISDSTYISLRLWNMGVESANEFNDFMKATIAQAFNLSKDYIENTKEKNGIKLSDHIFLQYAPRFEWPDGISTRTPDSKVCYALRDHIAILVDGSVVPCCIDANGNMILGNIFETDLGSIIHSDRAEKIRIGFANQKITEEFCKSCGFVI